MTPPFPHRLKDFAAEFDRRLREHAVPDGDAPAELVEAVRYSLLAPGKRLRPYLVTRCCELTGKTQDDAFPAAVAIECVHAFSLIHDDLPAMDNDELRRGQPTCHKKFGEATAILAGDALVVWAFEWLARRVEDRVVASRMIATLARATGWAGMIGGQAADVLGESRPADMALVGYIHDRKTAALFQAACELGALAGGGEASAVSSLGRYGREVGRAFQIADDLLDVTATAEVMGKGVGKDAAAGKQTYPRAAGVGPSRKAAMQAAQAAIAALDAFGSQAQDLRLLADYVVDRNY